MKTPKYICAKCRQPFTRRWNAYRHSNNKHFGSIENIISLSLLLIKKILLFPQITSMKIRIVILEM